MTLPADVARCSGVEYEDGWREGCEDCMRRTSPSDHPYQVWIEPPPIITFECEFRIEPIAELRTGDTGRG